MNQIASTIEHLAVPIADLHPHTRNPRNGDIEVIKESLQANSQYRPIVVDQHNTILAGNHTYAAAMELGWDRIAVTRVDVTPEEAERILLVDNRANDLARTDEALLAEILADLDGDYEGTGYSEEAVEDILQRAENADASSFLDGLINTTGEPEEEEQRTSTGEVYYAIKYTVTEEQREIIRDAISAAKGEFRVATSADALASLCRSYVSEWAG